MEHVNDEECGTCHGRKFIQSPNYSILEVCPKCNGLGYTDWVSCAMGQNNINHKPNKQLQSNICMKNINLMVHAITEQYRIMGMDVEVDIKPIQDVWNRNKFGGI